MPFIKKLVCFTLAGIIAASSMVAPTFADQPYDGYNYDWWGDPVPSQAGYVVDNVVSGLDLGTGKRFNSDAQLKDAGLEKDVVIGSLNEPGDLYIDQQTAQLYITDTKNNRILITDVAMTANNVTVMDNFYNPETKKMETLNSPLGVFILHDVNETDEAKKTKIYIADTENERVLGVYSDGTIFHQYVRPASDVYDKEVTFNPRKVVVDKAGNVYIVIKSITQGAVMFDPDGNFSGYFGANRVEQTAEVIANQFWKLILSRDAILKMRRNVSVEFANFDIDADGFIYTVTESKSASTDIFKKLNPAGYNIFTNLGYDEYVYGDFNTPYWQGVSYASQITDVDVDENGIIRLLDFTNGRVFEYNEECDLLFIYGGIGTQKGLFTSVSSIEAYNNQVYVLDSRKNSITTYKRTEFGDIVHTAISAYSKGDYAAAKGPWQEVLTRDSNYWFAYIGLGNAELSEGNYETAMNYFYRNSRGGYNRAFKQYRMEFIRENFNIFMVIILAVIVVLIVISRLLKSRKKKKKQMAGGN